MPDFRSPQWLWLLLAVVALLALYLLLQWRRKRYVVRFSNVGLLGSIAPKRPGWRRHLAFTLMLLALASFTVAMGRPSTQVKVPRDRATVMMVIDVSLSMDARDVAPTRLAAAQKAAEQFTRMLPKSINLGLVSFAGTATVDVRPTTNREAVTRAIGNLRLASSTATGDAIFAALGALQSFQASVKASDGKPAPSRIVMLSDGQKTVGRPVDEAIAAAKRARTPVSTIAFGTTAGVVTIHGQQQPVPVDIAGMKHIAEGTGGSAHTAASADELQQVYKNLGSQIGYTKQPREVTTWAVGIGLILAFAAAASSLLWTSRLL